MGIIQKIAGKNNDTKETGVNVNFYMIKSVMIEEEAIADKDGTEDTETHILDQANLAKGTNIAEEFTAAVAAKTVQTTQAEEDTAEATEMIGIKRETVLALLATINIDPNGLCIC